MSNTTETRPLPLRRAVDQEGALGTSDVDRSAHDQSLAGMIATPKRPSALDAARREALRTRITLRTSLCLDAEAYRMLRYDGFSRRDVDRTIDAMVAAREAVIETNSGTVRVRLRGEEEGE